MINKNTFKNFFLKHKNNNNIHIDTGDKNVSSSSPVSPVIDLINNIYNTDSISQQQYHKKCIDAYIKFKEKQTPIDNSNINTWTQTFSNRIRDLYGYQNNNSIQYLTFLMSKESNVSIGVYEYFLELLVKNETIATKILFFNIKKIFANISLKENFYIDNYKVDIKQCNDILAINIIDIITAISYSELYGGCYCCLDENNIIEYYSPSQFIQGEQLNKTTANGTSDLYKLNKMLINRNFDTTFLKEKSCEYLKFNDGSTYPYNKVFLMVSSKRTNGNFYKQQLNGLGFSIFEGNLHHLIAILEDLDSLHKQINIQNRFVLKMKDYTNTAHIASLRGMTKLKEDLETLVATRTSGGMITDIENDVQILSARLDIIEIVDYALLKLVSFIYDLPYNDLTGQTVTKYINTETVKTQKNTIQNHLLYFFNCYKYILLHILCYLFEVNNIKKINLKTNEPEVLKISDFNFIYE